LLVNNIQKQPGLIFFFKTLIFDAIYSAYKVIATQRRCHEILMLVLKYLPEKAS